MKSSDYKNLTLHIFRSINIIKQIKDKPDIQEDQYIDFKFKKPGFKKLLIFDLDETLIHVQREAEDFIQSNQTSSNNSSEKEGRSTLSDPVVDNNKNNIQDNKYDSNGEYLNNNTSNTNEANLSLQQ